jgi:hypothetical protein
MDQPHANRAQSILRAGGWLLLLACLAGDPAVAADKQAVIGMIEQAKELQEEARSKQHAWSATSDYIAGAQNRLAAGKLEQAQAMAERAVQAARASIKQADEEATAWQARVPAL